MNGPWFAKTPAPFPQRGPRSSHPLSVRKWEQRLSTAWVCGKYPSTSTKCWHSITALCSITTCVLRCSELPLTLLWVWIVSRSRLSPCCALHIYFTNISAILNSLFDTCISSLIKKGSLTVNIFCPLYLGFWKIQTRFYIMKVLQEAESIKKIQFSIHWYWLWHQFPEVSTQILLQKCLLSFICCV